MKKTISYLLLAHIVTTIIALSTNAGIYTLMYLYTAQAAILLAVMTLEEMRGKEFIYKFMSVTQAFIFAVLIATIFFLLSKLPETPVVLVDGVEHVLNLGHLAKIPLVLGSAAFLMNYLLDYRAKRTPQLKSSMIRNMHSFTVIFCNIASLILILFTAVMFSSSRTSIVIIAAIKTVLDIGLLVLTKALTSIDGPVHKFMARK